MPTSHQLFRSEVLIVAFGPTTKGHWRSHFFEQGASGHDDFR